MLTADLVHVHRRGDRLVVVPLAPAQRPRALELAASVLALVRAHVGMSRGALLEAWNQVALAPSETRLARGLLKLALDACDFEANQAIDPVELRVALFTKAAAARKGGQAFDRSAVVGEIATERHLTAETVDRALYADLPSAHVLRRADLPSAEGLLSQHVLASHQAVLLRAVRVHARVFSTTPSGYRSLFRRLKFHRLLYKVAKLDRDAGYALDIDGPYSLFEQTTKYGLNLALSLPAVMGCDAWDIRAELRWGKDRRPLRYHLRSTPSALASATTQPDHLPDEVAVLLHDLRRQETAWQASPSEAILNLPGIGICVPDLEFVHRTTGRRVFLEVLGFWSRAAVWKRVEMAQAGLPFPVVFAIGKHLRVSEDALPARLPAALYVYARSMSAPSVLERIEAVAER